jgi:hypothetical protein
MQTTVNIGNNMKIRNRLVANSSSATYLISIETDKIYELLFEAANYPYYWRNELLRRLENKLKENEELYERHKDGKITDLFLSWNESTKIRIEELKSRINKVKELPEYIDNENVQEIKNYTALLFEEHRIFMDVHPNGATLSGSTVMHNSYADMPEILKELITYILFERKDIKMTVEREDGHI